MCCNVVESDFCFPNLHNTFHNIIFQCMIMMTQTSKLICKFKEKKKNHPKNILLISIASILSVWALELSKKIIKHLYRDQIVVLLYLQISLDMLN